DQAAAALAPDRLSRSGPDGRLEGLCLGRSRGCGARPDRRTVGPDARGATRGAGAAGHPGWAIVDRSVPEGARDDVQKKSLHAAEQGRPDVAAAREAWRAGQPRMNPARLVFIDETWA